MNALLVVGGEAARIRIVNDAVSNLRVIRIIYDRFLTELQTQVVSRVRAQLVSEPICLSKFSTKQS